MRDSPRFLSILLMTVAWVVTAGQGQSGPGSAGQNSAGGISLSGQSVPINSNSAIAGSAAGEAAENSEGQSAEPGAPPSITSQTPATSVGPANSKGQTSTAMGNDVTEKQAVNSRQRRHAGTTGENSGSLPQTSSPLLLLSIVGFGSVLAGIAVRMRR